MERRFAVSRNFFVDPTVLLEQLRMKINLLPIVTLLSVSAVADNVHSLTQAAAKPNIVIIMCDDFGFECVRANGGESYKTPNLDRHAVRKLSCPASLHTLGGDDLTSRFTHH